MDFEISDPSQRKLLQVDFAFLSQGSKLRGIAKSKLHDNYRSPEWHGYGYQKTVLLAKIEGSKLEEAKFLIQKNQARYSIKFREEKFVYVRKNKFDLDDDSRNHCLRQVALICLGLRQLNDSQFLTRSSLKACGLNLALRDYISRFWTTSKYPISR